MKKIGIFFALLSFVLLFQANSNAQNDFVKQCVAAKITIGNNTYIPINLIGFYPDEKMKTIFCIIDEFEKQNTNIVVQNWEIIWKSEYFNVLSKRNYVQKIFGLKIQHEPNYKKPRK
jgi:hypothetical protein